MTMTCRSDGDAMKLIEFGSISHITKGKKPVNQSKERLDGFKPYVDIEAFETGKIKAFTDGKKCLPCKNGDILIVCDGSRSGFVGRAIEGYVGSTLAIISADGMTSDYLYYFLQGKYALLNTKKKGTGTPHLDSNILNQQKLVVPSVEEQERIVTKIEELFSELDNGVETLKKTKQQLEVYRQAVLKQAFTLSSAPCQHLEDLCFFITKGTTPAKTTMTSGSGDIPFIKVYNLTFDNTLDFSIDPTFVEQKTHIGFLERSITYPGDVLMNIVGPPMGKVSIVPNLYPEWNINQAIARFRCLDKLYNKYLAYFLSCSDTVEKMKSKAKATAGQFNLTLEICRKIPIPVPSIEEQKQIVFNIETKLSQQQKISDTIDFALQQAEAMRQSILKKAFEGEL